READGDGEAERPEARAAAAVAEGAAGGGEGSASPAAAVDPERERQLARQRRVMESARRRREEDPARAGLRRSVLVETAIAVVLLGVTTALTGTPPARTEAEAPPAAAREAGGEAARPEPVSLPYDTGGADGSGTATLQLDPSTVGENTLHLYLESPDGQANGAEEIRISLTLPGEGLGPLRFEPEQVAVGHWTVEGLRLPRPGEWELDLTIRSSAIDQTTETTTVTIAQ
ncbi:hypothetical protein EBN88_30060, partial [Streptomyces triticirhizae]